MAYFKATIEVLVDVADDEDRPADITLPEGWTWERVEAQRAKWGIAANMVPIVTGHGCVGWGTINSVRLERAEKPAGEPAPAPTNA